mmetsp:Transcript_40088/g.106019  ORF Transcript_40088/g.106019 Transcript_40088/m.106019 type:complete len:119 (+) Transcript_40088:274-630(+)
MRLHIKNERMDMIQAHTLDRMAHHTAYSERSATQPRCHEPWDNVVTFSGGSSPVQAASAHGAAVPGYMYGSNAAVGDAASPTTNTWSYSNRHSLYAVVSLSAALHFVQQVIVCAAARS